LKKFFSIVFLGVFVYNVAGYYLVFRILQTHRQNEMREACASGTDDIHSKDDDLTTLSLNNAEEASVHWRSGNEFEYNGHLYDVARTERSGNIVTYYCINDTNEESLIAGVNAHVQNHFDGGAQEKDSKISLKTPSGDYFCNTASVQICLDGRAIVYYQSISLLNSTHSEIPTPPPKA